MSVMLLVATILVIAGPAVAESPATQPSSSAVVNPWISTDKSVDTRTVDGIVKSLVRPGMTDEQKVLAVFNWIRRVIYHGDGPAEYAYNFGNMIHSFGNGSCLRQTTPMWVLLDRLGYKCRTGAAGGHHIIEVHYDGAWHLFDPHMTFYVYDRQSPRRIASIEQIKADPTLVTDAVKESRACPGFLLCGDSVSVFSQPARYRIFGDFPESTRATPVIQEPFGRIILRRGESFVRTWTPGQYWFKANWYKKDEGPRHGCGIRRDARDTVNLPLYEPHAVGQAYRRWSAGHLLYEPILAGDRHIDAVVEQKNVAAAPADSPSQLAATHDVQPGHVVFSVNCPYVITAGELRLMRSDDAVAAAVSTDRGQTWKPLELQNDGAWAAALFIDEIQGALDGYWLRLTIPPKQAMAHLQLKTHFQINTYSLPYLVPGRNTVSVSADAFGSPLTVEWVYAEGPQWTTNKTVTKRFDKPSQFFIEVGGEKYPRNVSLTLSVAP